MLTVKEVAQKLRVSAASIYSLIESGKMGCHRIGMGRGTIRVSEDDLSAFLLTCREATESTPKLPPKRKLRHLDL